jgi:hypothetical protein
LLFAFCFLLFAFCFVLFVSCGPFSAILDSSVWGRHFTIFLLK